MASRLPRAAAVEAASRHCTDEQLEVIGQNLHKEIAKPRIAMGEIAVLAKYYEASGDKFFLDKLRNILKHVTDGSIAELGLENDFSKKEILQLKFAFGVDKMTAAEAKELSGLLLADDEFHKCMQNGIVIAPLEFSFGAESILELKNELLAEDAWLHYENVDPFICSVGGLRAVCPVGARVRACLSSIQDMADAAKAWLRDPATQAELRDELGALKESIQYHDESLATAQLTDAELEALDLPDSDVPRQILTDRIECLAHLGITEE